MRSSLVASRFSADAANPRTIAADADVDLIVTGTLLRAADQVRVSAQLTEASSGSLIWSHTSEVAMGDLFRVQDQLSQQMVESLSLPLTPRDRRVLGRDVPCSSQAYELFLRGNRLGVEAVAPGARALRAMRGAGIPVRTGVGAARPHPPCDVERISDPGERGLADAEAALQRRSS